MTRVLGSRYELGRPLGVGGMAEIFEANDTRLARRVAVKILRADLPDPRALERFEREARIAARFNHPNAVTIYDVGDDGARPYLVMELIEGKSLAELLRERGPLEPGAAVSIISDVLLALSAAHASGVVHRDVKPGNILIGDDGRVKLADFGIAKAMSDASAGLTAIGQVIGTPRYLSPEQMRGTPATPRSDQYSAGIVLYEMLTGAIPVADQTVVAASARFGSDRPGLSLPPLVARLPGAPLWLGDVVDRSVAFDPADRFVDVASMRAALLSRGRGAASSPPRSTASARTQILETAGASAPRPPVPMPPQAAASAAGPSGRSSGPLSGGGTAWMLAVAALVAIIAAGSVAVALNQSGDDPDGATSTTVGVTSTRPASTSVAPTTRALSTTVATVPAVSTTVVATTVSATAPTTSAPSTTVSPTTTVSGVPVDINDVIEQLAPAPFSYGRSGEQLLIELRYSLELSREPSVGQFRKAVDGTRDDIVKWVAEGSLDADIGEQADRALVALRR